MCKKFLEIISNKDYNRDSLHGYLYIIIVEAG